MKQTSFSPQAILPEQIHASSPEIEAALNVAVIYQDTWTRNWAGQVCEQIKRVAGHDVVHCAWWQLGELAEFTVLEDAVRQAAQADVILVAIHAASELAPEFCVWVDAWLPRRCQTTGALIAMLGLSEPPGARLESTRDYLHAVARQGGLDFLTDERPTSIEALDPFAGRLPDSASASPRRFAVLGDKTPRSHNIPCWGINE